MEIHQGTGMVLGQLGISAAEALAQLCAPRIAEQRLLIHVAARRDVAAAAITKEMR